MKQGNLRWSIPTSAIFLVIGAIIFPIMIILGQNSEGGILLILIPGFLTSIICMGVGLILGIIDLVEAYRKKRI